MKKTTSKAVITTDTRSFNADGCLHLLFTGKYHTDLKQAMRGKKPGDALQVTIGEIDESKSGKQTNTFHELLMIYWQSGIPSDNNLDLLKVRIKHTYGVRGHKVIICGEEYLYLKSWSLYTLQEGRRVIDGLISEMLTQQVNDQKFLDMIDMWNDYKTGIVKPAITPWKHRYN